MKVRTIILSVLIIGGLFSTVLRATQSLTEHTMVNQAISNNNTPQLIKALIAEMKNKLEVDEDNFPALIQEVEAYTAKTTDIPSASVLHSMTAEMYNHYYRLNQWKIDQRTPIDGFIPEDMREWTSNIFKDTIAAELKASLKDKGILQQTSASTFKDIMTTGKDSPALRPTLYEFLAYRAVDIQADEEIYQDLLAYLRTKDDKRSSVLAELAYLQSTYLYDNTPGKRKIYMAAIDSLMVAYADKDYSVEIVDAKLNALNYGGDTDEETDSLRALQYQLCKETLARYPDYKRIVLIENRLRSLEESSINVRSNNTVYPGKELELTINYKNVNRINVAIYHSKRPVTDTYQSYYYYNKRRENTRGELVKEATFALETENTYTSADTTVRIPMNNPGLYEYELTVPDKTLTTNNLFSVSRLAFASRNAPEAATEIIVTDYQTGKPIDGATVSYYTSYIDTLRKGGQATTDKNGIAVLPDNKEIRAYQASVKGDTAAFVTRVYFGGRASGYDNNRTEIRLLTDRGLYRPGQTIFFKGITYKNDKDNPTVVAGQQIEFSFCDANYQEIAKKTFTTNEYGSFYGEFTIPRQGLTGRFSLQTDFGSTTVRVEEYKRPTFKVDIERVKDEVAFGDEVTIRGTAQTFSGVMLQSGSITYRIVKKPFWFRFFYGSTTEEQVAQGQTSVQEDGSFSFTFRPEKDYNRFYPCYQSYDIHVSVTDSKNETQEGRSTFSVGDRSMVLSADLRDFTEKETTEARITAMNLNGEPVAATGTYKICILDDTEKDNIYNVGKEAAQGKFTAGESIGNSVFAQLPSGRYRLFLAAHDSKGRDVEQTDDFVLYSKQDKRPPVRMHTLVLPGNVVCAPGEEASFIFGTSDRNAYVLYELFTFGKTVARQRIELSDENRTFRLPFLESYGDGVTASFTFLKEGKLYTELVQIQKRTPNRYLTIKPETFRDRLLPGSTETWKFRVQDKDSAGVAAEVLASMYDASLDKITHFAWSFSPVTYRNLYYGRFNAAEGLSQRDSYDRRSAPYYGAIEYAYDQIDWQGVLDFPRSRSYAFGGDMMNIAVASPRAMKSMSVAKVASDEVLAESVVVGQATVQETAAAPPQQEEETGTAAPTLRSNFNETAFFFPTLLTDKEGSVVVSFTIPESNTTWKLQTLAHTKDLMYGYGVKEAITQKPLMVLPNLPRFLRNGDEASISSQIMNLSDKPAAGTVRLELFDPATDQPVASATKAEQPFSLEAGKTSTVSWTMPVPEGYDLLGLRIIAESESGSDGEQHLLAILPNELLITESVPFYLANEEEKQIKVADAKPSATRRPYAMTLEYTDNPVWYAVQALPTLTQPAFDNVVSWFASYYSNTLAVSIAASNPRIKQVIEAWTAQGGTTETLLSNLEKNEELKNLLLQETPWVMDAKSETERKQRLALLFDVNRAKQARDEAMKVLIERQNESGGWGWYKGFYPSRAMTLFVLEGMAQLVHLNAVQYGQQEKEMQIKALTWLDKAMGSDYDALVRTKSATEKYVPSSDQVYFLYVRSFYRDIPEYGDAREGIRFFTNQAEKQWEKMSLYEKGQTALLMHRNGKKETASKILAWLRKTATTSADKGMYWANNKRENNFFHSPLDVHTLLMSAFAEIGTDTKETDRMKQWILNQKRTQDWATVPATVNAIYSLLATGSDWLNEGNKSVIHWGDKTIDASAGETATGYIKETVKGNEITPAMNTVTVRKQGNAPAWGAVYNQYFEAIDKVEKATGVLNVEKKLFVETNSGTQRQIVPVTAERPLRTGDKVVVRLTIRTDRDMEFVSLKDIRPGCFEPSSQISGYMFKNGLIYYHAPKDASENFFFDRLRTGTYVLEYEAFISRTGSYSGGIASIQCQYAPEFVAHTQGERLTVSE